MAHQFHFEHHRKEALVNRRRFSSMTAVLMIGLVVGVGVMVKNYSHASTSSTQFDMAGYKIDTANHPSGPFSGATVQLYRASNNQLVANQTPNPFHYASIGAASGGENFIVKIASPTSYSGWTIKGSTYCVDTGCNSFNPQASGYVAGASRTLKFAPGHTYNMRWIWQYTPPTKPTLSGSLSGSTVNMSWTASTQAGGAKIASYRIFSGATSVAGTTALKYSIALQCGTNFAYTVKALDANNTYSAASNTYSGTTPACPPNVTPRPATPAPATPKPATPKPATPAPTKKPVAAAPKPGSGTQSNPVAPGAAAADTTPPATPDGFTAASSDNGGYISLSWSEVSDPAGIKAYNLERSTDQSQWTALRNGTTNTSYEDADTVFSTHYYYRLTATDGAGNTSEYVLADAETAAFSQNADNSTDATLTSDDSMATVVIPAGALPDGADCSVVTGDASVTVGKDQSILAGPYQLLCKDSEGNQIASLTKALGWKYTLTASKIKGYKTPVALVFDDSSKSTTAKSAFNAKAATISFDQANGIQSLVLASKKKGLPFNLIVGIIVVIMIFAGAIVFILRRGQKQNYSEYIRSKYYDI